MFEQAIVPQYLRERGRILLACSLILALVATFVTVANAAPSAATHRGFAEGTGDKASLLRVEPIAGGNSEIAYCMNEHKQRPIAKEGNEELPQYAVTDATGKFAQYTETLRNMLFGILRIVLGITMPVIRAIETSINSTV